MFKRFLTLFLLISSICFGQQTRDEYFKIVGKPTFIAPTIGAYSVDYPNNRVWRSTSKTTVSWALETDSNVIKHYLNTSEKGDKGDAATITVGTTTTLPAGSQATVTNVGTSSNAVLNFGIPKGADGTGSTGPSTYFFNCADRYSNGHVLGNGQTRTLASLGYTNVTAGVTWPLVNGDTRWTMDVTKMTIDWIALQEAFLAMQYQYQTSYIDPGGRSYQVLMTLYLPTHQNFWPGIRRSQMFFLDFNGSSIWDQSTNTKVLLDRHPLYQYTPPAGQPSGWGAESDYVSVSITIRELALYQTNTNRKDYGNVLLRIGPSYHGKIEDCRFNGGAIGVLCYFGLLTEVNNCKFAGFGIYGYAGCTAGREISQPVETAGVAWVGATSAGAQTNSTILNHNSFGGSDGSICAVYFRGGWRQRVYDMDLEGSGTMTHAVLYEACDPSEDLILVDGLKLEQVYFSRSIFKVKAGKGKAVFRNLDSEVPQPFAPSAVEWEQPAGGSPVSIVVRCEDFNNGAESYYHKFCMVTTQVSGYYPKWEIKGCNVWNRTNIVDPVNWNTTWGNARIPPASHVKYERTPDANGW